LEAARAQYERRAKDHAATVAKARAREAWLANARLTVFVAGVAVVVAAVWGDTAWWPLGLAALVFAGLAIVHERAISTRRRAEAALAYAERCLRRLDGNWMGEGPDGTAFADAGHPFAGDIDLAGTGSLFQLLCEARTSEGQEALFRYLTGDFDAEGIQAQQAAVRELSPRSALREDLAVAGEVARTVPTEPLVHWAERTPTRSFKALLPIAIAMTAAAVVSVLLPFLVDARLWPAPLLILTVNTLFLGATAGIWRQAAPGLDAARHALTTLSPFLSLIEEQPVEAETLVRLKAQLDAEGQPPSAIIEELNRRIRLLDLQGNQLFALIGLLLLWPVYTAYALHRWRVVHGPHVARWMEAAGAFEALCSLAQFAYDHPEYVWPDVAAAGPVFQAEALAHPLLASEGCVANDVALDAETRLLIVTGSNMSGKSTLLRTCGLSLCLARAGAPVRAAAFRVSPLALGAAMRVQDSIQQGHSRFYAEINRLKQIVDLSEGPRPVLFLLDEILSSTNSHDRAAGAEAVVRTLVSRGSIGLVTSHDLAIARLEQDLAPLARNVHFQDEFVEGRLMFDYTLHDGVVQKSNAVALMRGIGLDV